MRTGQEAELTNFEGERCLSASKVVTVNVHHFIYFHSRSHFSWERTEGKKRHVIFLFLFFFPGKVPWSFLLQFRILTRHSYYHSLKQSPPYFLAFLCYLSWKFYTPLIASESHLCYITACINAKWLYIIKSNKILCICLKRSECILIIQCLTGRNNVDR